MQTSEVVFLDLLMQLRRGVSRHFFFESSAIPFDVLLIVFANFRLASEPMAIKSILLGLPYSQMAVRYHLKALVKRGFLITIPDKRDRRITRVMPSEKCIQGFCSLNADLKPFISDSPSLRS
jgi:DNA-binding transcriptional ArsR family regulator